MFTDLCISFSRFLGDPDEIGFRRWNLSAFGLLRDDTNQQSWRFLLNGITWDILSSSRAKPFANRKEPLFS